MEETALTWESYGITDIGLSRSNNEDVWTALPEKQFFLLADGMGGHKAGEVASTLTMQSMCASIHSLQKNGNSEKVCQFLRNAVAKANATVFKESCEHAEYSGMGTTLTCFILNHDQLIYAHVGDSRLYRYRDKLELLTEDHSLRQAFYSGEGGPPTLFLRNVITRAIGTQSSVQPVIGVILLRPNDVYMLCSDGLSDYVDQEIIARELSSELPLEEIGKKLVNAALESGGNDNITLLLVRICDAKSRK